MELRKINLNLGFRVLFSVTKEIYALDKIKTGMENFSFNENENLVYYFMEDKFGLKNISSKIPKQLRTDELKKMDKVKIQEVIGDWEDLRLNLEMTKIALKKNKKKLKAKESKLRDRLEIKEGILNSIKPRVIPEHPLIVEIDQERLPNPEFFKIAKEIGDLYITSNSRFVEQIKKMSAIILDSFKLGQVSVEISEFAENLVKCAFSSPQLVKTVELQSEQSKNRFIDAKSNFLVNRKLISEQMDSISELLNPGSKYNIHEIVLGRYVMQKEEPTVFNNLSEELTKQIKNLRDASINFNISSSPLNYNILIGKLEYFADILKDFNDKLFALKDLVDQDSAYDFTEQKKEEDIGTIETTEKNSISIHGYEDELLESLSSKSNNSENSQGQTEDFLIYLKDKIDGLNSILFVNSCFAFDEISLSDYIPICDVERIGFKSYIPDSLFISAREAVLKFPDFASSAICIEQVEYLEKNVFDNTRYSTEIKDRHITLLKAAFTLANQGMQEMFPSGHNETESVLNNEIDRLDNKIKRIILYSLFNKFCLKKTSRKMNDVDKYSDILKSSGDGFNCNDNSKSNNRGLFRFARVSYKIFNKNYA